VLGLERPHRGQDRPGRSRVDRSDPQQPARSELVPGGRAEPGDGVKHVGHRLEQLAPGDADPRSRPVPVKQDDP
jgi:hypothetical protein